MNVDVKIEARLAQDIFTQQTDLAPPLQSRVERLQQVAIFAAQINEALASADHPATQGHALKDQIGVFLHQHPILKGARLAFVSVAHHVLHFTGRIAARPPFQG